VTVFHHPVWVWEGSLEPFKFTKWWPGMSLFFLIVQILYLLFIVRFFHMQLALSDLIFTCNIKILFLHIYFFCLFTACSITDSNTTCLERSSYTFYIIYFSILL